jgi:iron complex transport system substrate-binding protein
LIARGLLVAAALTIGGCAGPSRPPVPLARHPTIVSLNPCADAILAEVTAPGQLLAITRYSHDPRASSMPLEQARRYPATGGTLEEIAALAPDLVVGDSFTAPATRNALRRLGIRFAELPIAPTIPASEAQIRTVARLVGGADRGERLVAKIDHSLAAAVPPPRWTPRSAILWQGGGLVAGDETLIANLMARAGFRSSAATRGLRQGAILPLEAMLADPPQVIFTAGDPRAEQDRLLRHPVLAGLTGTARAQLAPGLFYCGGPSIPRALARLVEIRTELETPFRLGEE